MNIYLDIDGVLHASDVGELEYGPLGPIVTGVGVCELETILADVIQGKGVRVVIHSSWVRMFDLKTFQVEYIPRLSAVAEVRLTKKHIESRTLRILDYARRNRILPEEYLILDDAADEFLLVPTLVLRLVVCDPARGVNDPGVLQKIREFLE